MAAQKQATFLLIDIEGSASHLTSFEIAESDLVIISSGEEQKDADAAVETFAEIEMEGRARRRAIPAAILFARTSAAVKSKLEKHIHAELARVGRIMGQGYKHLSAAPSVFHGRSS